ncbi:MAG: nucleic acid-binding protein [Acidobacteriota bacterium]
MNNIILLDTGPLGLASNPQGAGPTEQCNLWLDDRLAQGFRILVPEIADYELRRELVRAGKIKGIAKLNGLKRSLGFLPITTRTMLKAADFWAQARRIGKQTASDSALDGDMILAAQGAILQDSGRKVIIATTNVKHLELFIDACFWSDNS